MNDVPSYFLTHRRGVKKIETLMSVVKWIGDLERTGLITVLRIVTETGDLLSK